MRRIAFLPTAFKDLKRWKTKSPKIYQQIKTLLKDMERDPFSQQISKPEPLKDDLKGLWAKCINEEHYLIYKVTNEEIVVASCRFYY